MTYDEYLAEMLGALPDTYQKSPGYPVYDIVSACAIAAAQISDEVDAAKAKLYIDNLTGTELDSYVYDRAAISRYDGEYAYGTVTAYGNGSIPAGTIFSTSDNLTFQVTEDTEIETSGEVSVSATSVGSKYNVAAGAIKKFPITLGGFSSISNSAAMTGGADAETDDELRERYRDKMQNPPLAGNVYAYRSWALSIDGVGGAKVVPLGHGAGTVDVYIVSSSGDAPSDELVTAVQSYIDPSKDGTGQGEAPIGATCYVSAATFTSYDVSATVTLEGTAAQADVDTALKQAVGTCFASAFTSGYLRYSDVFEAIIHTDGVARVQSLTIGGKYADIELPANNAAKIGTWGVTYDN